MSSEQSIVERLQTLERENRRFKRIGIILIIIAASLLLMAQAPGKRIVDANEFILRDGRGIVRGKWSMTADGAELSLLDAAGNDRVNITTLATGTPLITLKGRPLDGKQVDSLRLLGPDRPNSPQIWLTSGGSEMHLGPGFLSSGSPGSTDFVLARGGELKSDGTFGPEDVYFQMRNRGGYFDLAVSEKPSLRIQDKDGFFATLGSMNLLDSPTGQTRNTSAASLTLFRKDGRVMWQAP